MKHSLPKLVLSAAILMGISLTISSCSSSDSDTPAPNLNLPAQYTSANFATNASTELGVVEELEVLVGVMKRADGGNAVSATDLANAWEGSTLKAITVSSYAEMIDEWLPELAAASGNTFDLENAPNGQGGLYGAHTLDETGLELEQMVEKGLFCAAHYQHAVNVIQTGNLTEASIDQLVAIFGAGPTFPNDDTDPIDKDVFTAKYAERRTPASGGLYLDIRDNLITAKAAIAAGSAFDQDRDEALAKFLTNWEKAIMATTIYYINDASNKITNGLSQSGEEQTTSYADALHSLGEGIGFAYGLYAVPSDRRIISNQELSDILKAMQYEPGGTSSPYLLITDPGTVTSGNLADMNSTIATIQGIYGFSDTEVSGFFVNN